MSKTVETTTKDQQDERKQLEEAIKTAGIGLNTRQKKFASLIAAGDQNGTSCAKRAGYAPLASYAKSAQLLRHIKIRVLIDAHRDLNTYLYGKGIAFYRAELTNLLEIAKEDRAVTAANGVVRTMAELDGYLGGAKSRTKASVVINVIGLDRSTGVTIEHES